MPSSSAKNDLLPVERCRQVAAIIARGVVRSRHAANQREIEKVSLSRNISLELVSETRLTVSRDFVDQAFVKIEGQFIVNVKPSTSLAWRPLKSHFESDSASVFPPTNRVSSRNAGSSSFARARQ